MMTPTSGTGFGTPLGGYAPLGCALGVPKKARGDVPSPVPEVGVIIITLYHGKQNSSAGMPKTLGHP